jgi:hypothetical protein
MPAIINNLSSGSGVPGIRVIIIGSGFAAGALAVFATTDRSVSVPAEIVSDIEVAATVPDLLDGLAGVIRVSVTNPSEEASNELEFSLLAFPDVETVQPLCSLGRLKQSLGVASTETADDERYRRLIQIASAQIIREAKREFWVQSILNELHDGDGTNLLEVHTTPIVSVSALSIEGQAIDPTELAIYPVLVAFKGSADWNPRLRSYSRLFPVGRQNVSISYMAGYLVLPADVSDACVIQVMHLMNTLHKQGIVSESNQVAQSTTAYAQVTLAPPVRVVANRYRKSRMKAI